MHHNTNHRHPDQPIQAPPSLLPQVLGRIQRAEQAAEDTELFSQAFTSSDWSLRVAAIEQLARADKEMALPWLERALSDEHPAVRAWAVHALAQHQASALILPTLHDPDWQVREAAMLALGMQDEQIATDFPAFAQDDPEVAIEQPARVLLPHQPLSIVRSGGTASMRLTDPYSTQPISVHEEEPALRAEQARSERVSTAWSRERSQTQRKRLPRFLGLVAAVLVSAMLIGSLALLYSASQGATPGSHGVKSSATATTAAVPPECRDVQDQVDETLCAQHKETILNITKNFSGHKITFVRAYADPSQLRLIYTTTDSPRTDTISFMGVTIQQGIRLGGGGGLQIVYQDTATQLWYYEVNFTTQGIPAGTTTLHVESILDAYSTTPTPLNFTTPFHSATFDATQKSVSVNQTVTSNGITLTLDHVAFTIGDTFIYLKTKTPKASAFGVRLNSLTINGQQVASYKDALGGTDPLVIQISKTLQDKPGAWTVQIIGGISKSNTTWTFRFKVDSTIPTK
ncbi:MAG TPA: HEAT repeat domain-containing protein [Ktedonobacteraceae bacterium]|jgi:hypothetical protein